MSARAGAASEASDTELAAQRAREAYRYVARTCPDGAPLEALGRADWGVLEAQERRDCPAYEEALRELCRPPDRRAAIRRAPRTMGAL
jgi:hypothetical protein